MSPLINAFKIVAGRASAVDLALIVILAAVQVPSACAQATVTWPGESWPTATPAAMGLNADLLDEAAAYAQAYGGAGLIVRHGHVVRSWGDSEQRFDLKSTTKSIGATALGIAIQDGLVSLTDGADVHLPTIGVPPSENATTGWLKNITLQQLATHTAGFAKPGGYGELLHEPATAWLYSDGGLNWLADVLTARFHEDLNALLFRRVFTPLGITTADLVWRSHAYREDTLEGVKRREFGSGIKANVDAMARIGYLYLRRGVWNGDVLLPAGFIDAVRQPTAAAIGLPVVGGSNPPGTSNRYGIAWFTNSDGTLSEVPRDAYWAWGLLDSLILVIPSLDIVVARTGNGLGRSGWNADYAFIEPFIAPIARAAASGVPTSLVPDVTGLPEAAAVLELSLAGLEAGEIERLEDPAVPIGHVIAQEPAAGTEMPAGSSVALDVSLGASAVAVPDVVGRLFADAVAMLEAAGLTVGAPTAIPSSTIAAGAVIAQVPAPGTLTHIGAAAELQVSSGPAAATAWLAFDGANDVASVASSAKLKLSDQLSIEARIRPRSLSTNKRQDRLLRKGADYELMISSSGAGCHGGTRGHLQLSVTLGGTVRKVCGGSLALDAWQHVAATYDGAQLVLYIDGSRVGSLTAVGAIKQSGTLVTLGNVKALTRAFHGDMAEIAIWKRALTPAEVSTHAYEAPGASESGLVAHWPARDGSGQAIRDAGSNGLHGRLGLTSSSESSDPAWER